MTEKQILKYLEKQKEYMKQNCALNRSGVIKDPYERGFFDCYCNTIKNISL